LSSTAMLSVAVRCSWSGGDDACAHRSARPVARHSFNFADLDQRRDDRPIGPTAWGAPAKQRILASQSHRSHGALADVGVQFQAAICRNWAQPIPVVGSIADRLWPVRAPGKTRSRLMVQTNHCIAARSAGGCVAAHKLALLPLNDRDAARSHRGKRSAAVLPQASGRFRGDMDVVETCAPCNEPNRTPAVASRSGPR